MVYDQCDLQKELLKTTFYEGDTIRYFKTPSFEPLEDAHQPMILYHVITNLWSFKAISVGEP